MFHFYCASPIFRLGLCTTPTDPSRGITKGSLTMRAGLRLCGSKVGQRVSSLKRAERVVSGGRRRTEQYKETYSVSQHFDMIRRRDARGTLCAAAAVAVGGAGRRISHLGAKEVLLKFGLTNWSVLAFS